VSTIVAAPLAAGAVLAGRYRIVRTLGVGAWGRVYLATDTADVTAPQVAIKEMHGDDSASADEQAEAIAWFKREVSTLLALAHPGIPRVHGYWTAAGDRGPFYLAMDYVPGKTLEETLADRSSPLPWREAASWGVALCAVLAYLHGRAPAYIFRDLKLSNVILDERNGQPVLIDFGIARQLGPSGGTAIGTDGYAPLEQYMGKAETRSDLYALGATLHALVTGRHPNTAYTSLLRQGKTVEETFRAVFPPAHTLSGDVPPALSVVIARATAFAPEDRFATAAEMGNALHAALDDRPLAATVIARPLAIPTPTPAPPTPTPAPPTSPAAPDPSLWGHVARTSPAPPAPSLRGEWASASETRPVSVSPTSGATGGSMGATIALALGGIGVAGLLVGLVYWSVTSAPHAAPSSLPVGSPFVAMKVTMLKLGGVERALGVSSVVLGVLCLAAKRLHWGMTLFCGGIALLLLGPLTAFVLSAFS